jgi:hypothetical protein
VLAAAVHQQPPVGMHHGHEHATVQQPAGAHLGAAHHTQHPVVLVDQVDLLATHRTWVLYRIHNA